MNRLFKWYHELFPHRPTAFEILVSHLRQEIGDLRAERDYYRDLLFQIKELPTQKEHEMPSPSPVGGFKTWRETRNYLEARDRARAQEAQSEAADR